MQSKLDNLRNRIKKNHKDISLADEQFMLIRELGCLGDILGREYEFIKKNGELVGFKQKPIPIPVYIKLIEAFEKFKKIEKEQMPKGKGKR